MTTPAWIPVGSFAVALLALLYTVIVGQRAKHRKIVWRADENALVLIPDLAPQRTDASTDSDAKQRRGATLEMINAGKVPLTESDTSVPPAVKIAGGKIIEGRIYLKPYKSKELEIIPYERLTGKRIESPKVLLNPGDRLTFILAIEGDDFKLTADLRAAGFDAVPATSRTFKSLRITGLIAIIAFVTGLISGALGWLW